MQGGAPGFLSHSIGKETHENNPNADAYFPKALDRSGFQIP